MNKIFKRLLSVVLALVMVVTLVPLSSVETVKAAEGTKTIYLDTTQYKDNGSNGWAAAYIHLFNNNGDKYDATMTAISPGLYSYEVDTSKYTSVVFKPNSDNWSGKTVDLTIPSDSKNMYYCTTFGSQTTGTWRTYSGNSGESDSSTFYVRADLIDYYNNYRVGKSDSLENRYNNQGNWTGPSNNNAPYSALNNWISSLPGYADVPIDTNEDETRTIYWDNNGRVGDVYIHYWDDYNSDTIKMEYTTGSIYKVNIPATATNCLFASDQSIGDNNKLTGDLALTRFNLFTYQTKAWSYYGESSQSAIPLYFGDLFHRVQLTGDPNGTVNEFYRGANVSFTGEKGAVAQGIVGDNLVNGCLVTSYSDEVKVPFFEEGAYEDQDQYMKFYKNLQFPFTATTDGEVTKYSFDSKEQTVYYDYESRSIKSSSAVIQDASESQGRGYFPFNQNNPSDKSELNYGFGTKFTIPFTISPDGKDANNQDVTFNFTGDDDVWVFIDDALVLDMGGAHELASGNINFYTQTATVTTGTADATIDYNIYGGNSEFVSNNNETVHFSDITVKMSNGKTSTLADYMKKENTVHTLTMYYMERGMWNSNMSIDFSFIPLPSGMTLSKQVNTANVNAGLKTAVEAADTFDFEIKTKDLKEPNSTFKPVENLGYTVTSRNKISFPEQSASNGVVEGLSSVFYAHNFIDTTTKGKIFYSGTGFEITEMIPKESALKYESTEWKVYDGSNLSTPEEQGTDMTAKFSMGNADSSQFDVYTKYVNFINTPQVGNVTFTKTWQTGAAEDGDKFEFTVLVDIDGDGSDYEYTPYALDYTYIGSDKAGETTGSDGKFSLQSGEKIQFNGIPVGAKVKVTETPEENAYWEAVNGEYEKEITVTEGENNSLEIQNTSKAVTLDKVIYVEAGKTGGTDYTIKDGDDTVKVETAKPAEGTPSEEITVTPDATTGSVKVYTTTADKEYSVQYTGRKENGTPVSGTITAYTYKAADRVYVFDYGLDSELTDTTYGNGLFQEGVYFNTEAEKTSSNADESKYSTKAVLKAITPNTTSDGEHQTVITPDASVTITDSTGVTAGKVICSINDFMERVETYEYQVNITRDVTGVTLSEDNPETGTVVTGNVKVMPANVVYYEDNFEGIKYDITLGGSITQSNDTDSKQSNANDTTHGNDIIYNGTDNDSDGTSTKLERNDSGIPTFSFSFKGTGFDIVGRTTTTSAKLTVVVEDSNGKLVKTGVVDTYYSNGDLYQIPVISIRDLAYQKYTAKVAVVSSTNGGNVFYLDGIRTYNPLEETTEYPDEAEQKVTFANIHQLLVGTGEISEDRYDDGTILSVTADGSQMVLVSYDEYEEKAVLYGDTNTEDQGNASPIYTASLVDYLNKGPNNEVYLDPDVGIAFDVKGNDIKTIQVEAKQIDISSGDDPTTDAVNSFSLMQDDGSLVPLEKVSSKTAMYYNIPVESCIKINGGYRVILIAHDTVSISNIKYTKECEMSVPGTTEYLTRPEADPDGDGAVYQAQIENISFSPSAKALKSNKRVKITVTLDDETDFDHFVAYMVPDTEDVATYIMENESEDLVRDSETSLTYTFYAPKVKGKYNFVLIPVNKDNVNSCYQKSVAVKVK